jgi:uncharacterized membrane protein YhdT
MALFLSIAYLKVFLMAYLSMHGLRIFVFYKFIIYDCLYVNLVLFMLSQLISCSVIWKDLSCNFQAPNCLFMVDLILILNF